MFLWRWQWQTWCIFFFFWEGVVFLCFSEEGVVFLFLLLSFFLSLFPFYFFFYFFFKVQIQREPWETVWSRFSEPCGWTAVWTVTCFFGIERFLSIKEPLLWEVHGFSGRTVRSGPGFKTMVCIWLKKPPIYKPLMTAKKQKADIYLQFFIFIIYL